MSLLVTAIPFIYALDKYFEAVNIVEVLYLLGARCGNGNK